MNKQFIHDDFLLQNNFARELYHDYAKDMPIIDYHCHLPPAEIANDQRWYNIAQLWLGADHYKWRVMRTAGINEKYITGPAADKDKFQQFAQSMPAYFRNPIYHWSHMELKNYFNFDSLLNSASAEKAWSHCNEIIASPEFSAKQLIEKSNVKLICTTDDPLDSLEHHAKIASDSKFSAKVLPTFRPDKAHAVNCPQSFNAWVDKLAELTDINIDKEYDRFIEALDTRHKYFDNHGCMLADHGLSQVFSDDYTHAELHTIFMKLRNGKSLTSEQKRKFMSAVLHELMKMNHKRNWTQQIHYGVLRNNSSRMFEKAGADTGFDSVGDWSVAAELNHILDRLDKTGNLARTIIYNCNPADNAVLATMLGNFQQGPTKGKIQLGSAWWFLDHISGMTDQINALSSMGLLSCFVGMLTDSRSFLSYTRHEYFRRLLCNILASDINQGLLPADMPAIGKMVQDISYNNAKNYFQW